MNSPNEFTANYLHYQMTAERFTSELDRLTDQAELIEGQVQETKENVGKLVEVAEHIGKEVERAITAWGDGSGVVKQTAEAAQKAALSGVQQATTCLISKVNAATAEANKAVAALQQTQRRVLSHLLILALAFLTGVGTTIAIAYLSFNVGVESEVSKADKVQSGYFMKFWNNATPSQKKDFEAVMSQPPK